MVEAWRSPWWPVCLIGPGITRMDYSGCHQHKLQSSRARQHSGSPQQCLRKLDEVFTEVHWDSGAIAMYNKSVFCTIHACSAASGCRSFNAALVS